MPDRSVRFAREPFTDALYAELSPLLLEHWREVAHYQDIQLAPDLNVYRGAEAGGMLRVYTVRNPGLKWRPFLDPDPRSAAQIHAETNAMRKAGIAPDSLAGYAIFFVRPNPHYSGSVQAVQDVIFLDKSIRGGNGYRFIAWCDIQLQAEGVQAVYHHVKLARNFGPMLERQGYEAVDVIYAKRLDLPRDGRSARLTETSAETRPVRSGVALTGDYLPGADPESLAEADRQIAAEYEKMPWAAPDALLAGQPSETTKAEIDELFDAAARRDQKQGLPDFQFRQIDDAEYARRLREPSEILADLTFVPVEEGGS